MTGEKQKASSDSEGTGSREWPHPGAAQTGPVAVREKTSEIRRREEGRKTEMCRLSPQTSHVLKVVIQCLLIWMRVHLGSIMLTNVLQS